MSVADLPKDIGVARREELSFAGPVRLLDEVERRNARWAVTQLGGRKMLTADKLGIDRKTLARLLGGKGDDPPDDVGARSEAGSFVHSRMGTSCSCMRVVFARSSFLSPNCYEL